ncbi:MAG: outer membrane protein transport protein [Archangium sp.]|nr:outer membrane protein transport protein [Archangium sp.]
MRHIRLAVVVAGLSASAQAAGFYFGDNGSKALAQGGAFTAQADDASAIQYNPAGLAQQKGFGFLLDVQLINHQVSFLRQDPGNVTVPGVNTIQNTGGLFLLPFLGASYALQLGSRTLTLAAGVYGPPSAGRYQYPEPVYGRRDQSPRTLAPQRYALINNDVLILYPTLSAAIDVHPKVMLGVSLQLVASNFMFRQALYTEDVIGPNPTTIREEDPEFDAIAKVNLPGRLGFTGIFGAMFKPTDSLSFGASIRPPIPITASGSLDVAFSDTLKNTGAEIQGNTADLTMTLPLELRVGARFMPMKTLGINADFVYQGWQSVDALVLTPTNVNLKASRDSDPEPLAPLRIPKNWKASFSGRVGASYDVMKYLTVHAGVLYETSASPDAYYSVDFAHPDRVFFSAGATGHLSAFDVIAGIAYTPITSKTVAQSEVRRGQTRLEGAPVGTGVYTSGGFSLTVGVRGRFGADKAATSKDTEEARAP